MTASRCPKCQSEIPAGAPEGLCPRCLLQESRTGPYTPKGGFVPPAIDQLKAAFPQWEILELLGQGGMGAVYKARQATLDRLIAVKILPPEFSADPAFVERFLREARALAKLNHPNIVGIYDFGQSAGYCYFAMEYVDGVNLRQAIRNGDLKPAETLKIVPQVCEALQYAHDEGIVHRDIKPENILLDRKGRVKIADFGLAKLLGDSGYDLSLTGTRQIMGTLRYMAPEQMEGAKDVDHRADIYSLGVTFYEMLTGEVPMGRFAPPSKKVQIDVRLDEVVLRSLEREPEQRYQHASEVKTEVESIASSEARPIPSPPAPVKSALAGDAQPPSPAMPSPAASRWPKLPWPVTLVVCGVPTAMLLTAILGFDSAAPDITDDPAGYIRSVDKLQDVFTWVTIGCGVIAAVYFGWAIVHRMRLVGPPLPELLLRITANIHFAWSMVCGLTACGTALQWLSLRREHPIAAKEWAAISIAMLVMAALIGLTAFHLRKRTAWLLVILHALVLCVPAGFTFFTVVDVGWKAFWNHAYLVFWLGVPLTLWTIILLLREDVQSLFPWPEEKPLLLVRLLTLSVCIAGVVMVNTWWQYFNVSHPKGSLPYMFINYCGYESTAGRVAGALFLGVFLLTSIAFPLRRRAVPATTTIAGLLIVIVAGSYASDPPIDPHVKLSEYAKTVREEKAPQGLGPSDYDALEYAKNFWYVKVRQDVDSNVYFCIAVAVLLVVCGISDGLLLTRRHRVRAEPAVATNLESPDSSRKLAGVPAFGSAILARLRRIKWCPVLAAGVALVGLGYTGTNWQNGEIRYSLKYFSTTDLFFEHGYDSIHGSVIAGLCLIVFTASLAVRANLRPLLIGACAIPIIITARMYETDPPLNNSPSLQRIVQRLSSSQAHGDFKEAFPVIKNATPGNSAVDTLREAERNQQLSFHQSVLNAVKVEIALAVVLLILAIVDWTLQRRMVASRSSHSTI